MALAPLSLRPECSRSPYLRAPCACPTTANRSRPDVNEARPQCRTVVDAKYASKAAAEPGKVVFGSCEPLVRCYRNVSCMSPVFPGRAVRRARAFPPLWAHLLIRLYTIGHARARTRRVLFHLDRHREIHGRIHEILLQLREVLDQRLVQVLLVRLSNKCLSTSVRARCTE